MSPEDSPRVILTPTNSDQAERVRNQEMVTLSVIADRLPRYYEAARLSGFEVTEIAEPDQAYVTFAGHKLITRDSPDINEKPVNITSISPPVSVGYLGIAIEKPEESQDYGGFWKAFDSLAPEPAKS